MSTSAATIPESAPRARWRRRQGKPLGVSVIVVIAALAAGAGICAAAVATLLGEPEAGGTPEVSSASAPGQIRPGQPVLAHAAHASAQGGAQAAGETRLAPRRVYPFSIVPGGVTGKEELIQAIRNDKLVADHYADFKVDQAYTLKVSKPRAVYVSYRKGDKIYWTSKKLTLAVGETLISDGMNEARARCANRISDLPRLPVETNGPSEEELDSSVMQVSSAAQGDEGTPYVHQLQTFDTDGNPAPGQDVSMPGMTLSMDNPSGTGDSGTTYTTVGSSSTSTSGRPEPGAPETGSTGGETPGGTAGGGTPGGTSGGGTPGGTGVSTPQPSGDPETGTPGGGTPPTGGQGQPGGGTPPSQPPVGTNDPVPELTPLIPKPGSPPLPENPDESATEPADLPEPGTLWLGAGAFAAFSLVRRKIRTAKR